jgi:uncharacterized membrane protein YkvA (DUF1232 family)
MKASSKQPRVESFHRLLEQRVEEWLASEEARRFPCAELYRHLPPLFLFLAELALDPQIPERERTAVLSALKYIVAPFDLIPEGVVGTSGFRDDLVLAALVVDRLAARVDHRALLAHWREGGDPFEVARTVLDAGDAMVGPEICERLRDWLPA